MELLQSQFKDILWCDNYVLTLVPGVCIRWYETFLNSMLILSAMFLTYGV